MKMISNVIRALRDLGKVHFLMCILQKRSTSGRPMMDRTPDTRMYTTMFLKNHAIDSRRRIPRKIRMFLKVAFILKAFPYANLIQIFLIRYKYQYVDGL